MNHLLPGVRRRLDGFWRLGSVLAVLQLAPACGGTSAEGTQAGAGGADPGDEQQAGSGGSAGSAGAVGVTAPISRVTQLPGAPCVPSAEFQSSFAGFAASDVTVELNSPYCAEQAVCLIDHFQGRVSCPYGQDSAAEPDACRVPGGSEVVTGAVSPQRLDRRADDAVYCSCRCDGPDPAGSYCQCDAGFECVERIAPLASGLDSDFVGSYCVRARDVSPDPLTLDPASCERGTGQCGPDLGLPSTIEALAPTAPRTHTASPYLVPAGQQRKLDLLFMVDNSIAMADKQAVLRRSVGELLARLVNPLCVDDLGNTFPAPVPGRDCAQGQRRQLAPITDLHVGFVSSSLGDVGANQACAAEGFPRSVPDRVDMAHLIGSLPRGQGTGGNAQGFLEWRSGQAGFEQFRSNAQRMLDAVGESGCGWENSLESWYRLLVDPFPYQSLTRVACTGSTSAALNCVRPATGPDERLLLDEALLAQRAAFLRPDSSLAVVMLTDENDCSLQVGNQSWVFVNIEDTRPFFRGSSTCATDPNAKCCYSCPLGPPDGCDADPICTADPANVNRLSPAEDGQNLRCYDQQRRFGLEILYPTQRYVNALTRPELCWNALDLAVEGCAAADLVPNPLYARGRAPSQVLLAGLIGVPWQALAASVDSTGRPVSSAQLRFKSAAELRAPGDTTWAQIAGSPGVRFRAAAGDQPEVASVPRTPPTLPQMIESEFARPGVVRGNALNGRDYDTVFSTIPDDLEYACIFQLAQPRDCAALHPAEDNCECFAGVFDRPLCEQTPGQSPAGTTQYWGGARPGARQLEVLRAYGDNSVLASVCPRNLSDASKPDFGYRPALEAVLERLQTLLPSEPSGSTPDPGAPSP
jgi:hypothetical protein